MTSWTKELDEAAELVTKSGHWHVVLFYLLCALAAIPTSFLVFSQVFTNATPEHWCAPQPELEVLGLSEELLRNLTVPAAQGQHETCKSYMVDIGALYKNLSKYMDERSEIVHEHGSLRMTNFRQFVPAHGEEELKKQISHITDAIIAARSDEAVTCVNGWRFSTTHYKKTLVTEYSLVCENDWLPQMSNTLFWVGSIFGNLFFGWMSDRYGRRPTTLLMITLEVPISIAASFSSSYWAYTALRVAGGLFFPALYQQPFILALELMPPARRTYAGIIVGMFFATGMCLLSLVAYVLRDWFLLSLATSLPFIGLFSFFWFLPESPRWLVSRGRIADAEKVFREIGRKNGIILPRGFLLEIHKKIKDQENADEEITMLANVNGHIRGLSSYNKEECIDRRISNMLTFKPDIIKVPEIEESIQADSLERIIALEVADIVNKKSRLKVENNVTELELRGNERLNQESRLHSTQKSTQTESFTRFDANMLRRKSTQLVNKIFSRDEDNNLENRRMDEENSEGDCKASPLDVFRYPNIRKKFFLLTFEWVALGVVYNSLSYNSPNLGVDDYLAFFIGGAVEVPSYFIAWRCMDRFGRRWVLCVFACIGGIACLSCILVPDSLPWVTVSFAMLGRLCAASSFAVFYVLIGELLPTVLRAQAMGAASFISGLGLLSCPYIVHLAKYSRALPLTIMGVLSLMGGVTSLFLPETLHQPLPQTLGDGEMFGKNFKILSCVQKPNVDQS